MRAELQIVQRIAQQMPRDDLPALLGELEQLRCEAMARLMSSAPALTQVSDELLNVTAAARLLGISVDYLYRNKDHFPFVVRVGRSVKFSALGIAKYIANKRH